MSECGCNCCNSSCKYGKLYPIDLKIEDLRMKVIGSWILPLNVKRELYKELEDRVDEMIEEIDKARHDYFN